MKLIFGSSPFRGNICKNIEFAKKCAKYISLTGNSPCFPHLFFPQFLNDQSEDERNDGIRCGLKWLEKSDEAWFFAENESKCTEGMQIELGFARKLGIPVKFVSPSVI